MCPVGSIDGSSSRGGMLGTQDRVIRPESLVENSFDRVHHPVLRAFHGGGMDTVIPP